ncbi:MAG: hypothetical protein KKF30_16030 [Proteobacteria bacterium]|nr:hypothetical protein [Pseudomonadota bacterium]MBU4472067.1 hypothetical protein [Pseudomonadota bacterium]MCG2752935.1 hypothetical protein [Desulfobacteraceae bacterium]
MKNAQNTFGIFGVALKYARKNCPVQFNDAYIYDSRDVDAHYSRKNLLRDDKAEMVFLSALPSRAENDFSVTALTGVAHEESRL